MLVVISVIALLLSILLPALGQARRAGRAMTCLSNLRQVGLADSVYANDFDEWITPLASDRSLFPRTGYTGDSVEWSEILGLLGYLSVSRYDTGRSAYVPTESSVVCPDLAVAVSGPPSGGVMGSHRSTYGHRTRLGDRSGQFIRRNAPEVRAASAVPYKVDTLRYSYPQQPPLMFFEWDNVRAAWTGGFEDSGGVTIHSGAMNTLFFDGHAEPVTENGMQDWLALGHADFYFRANLEYVDLTAP